jgi:hypothetical protein
MPTLQRENRKKEAASRHKSAGVFNPAGRDQAERGAVEADAKTLKAVNPLIGIKGLIWHLAGNSVACLGSADSMPLGELERRNAGTHFRLIPNERG